MGSIHVDLYIIMYISMVIQTPSTLMILYTQLLLDNIRVVAYRYKDKHRKLVI